jgi:hypothetical protein
MPQTDGSLLVLQSSGQKATVAGNDVDNITTSKVSAMPEGLLNTLTVDDIVNLFAYLNKPPDTAVTSRRAESGMQ